MRRRTCHLLFGAAALACGLAVLVNGLRLQQARQTNRAIAAAARQPVGQDPAPAPSAAPREVRLARAIALAEAGAYDAAFKAYGGLIQQGPPDAVARQALFNLGNMHLRQGAAPDASVPAMTMVELAKQRYRDLLRIDPGDWDARYNLERALRLAPEEQAPQAEQDIEPVERRRVRAHDFPAGDLP
ncbi:MxaK protein [Piscinibacter sp. XHJ-5]|uniref:MxaK protein n=1 Tax=Piscinibacter sp. XHJ-5 TaxID=3037797 RepID=UPI00245295EE|nr:MxaK protein [Piscinibacter sp. XHJ-5]